MITIAYKGLAFIPDPSKIPATASDTNIDQGANFAHIDMESLANNFSNNDLEAWVVLYTPQGRFVSDWHKIGEWKDPSSYWNGANNFFMIGSFYDLKGNKIETINDARQENGVFYMQHTFGSITVNFDKATMFAVVDDAMYQKWHALTISGGRNPYYKLTYQCFYFLERMVRA